MVQLGTEVKKLLLMTNTLWFNNIITGYSTIYIQIRLSAKPTRFIHPEEEKDYVWPEKTVSERGKVGWLKLTPLYVVRGLLVT
jgi:hypothetical protein